MKAVKLAILVIALCVSSTCLQASDKPKEKGSSHVADSGSFGIFLNGKRVGTETFNITETLNGERHPEYSTATSEIKFDDGRYKATQTAEMQISAKGELRSYAWHATVPQKEEATVEPKDQLLVEHIIPADQKKMDVPHMLPASTVILDDNFFSQREILLWWYLARGCKRQDNGLMCGTGKFVILVPHQHVSGNATLELIGQDKVLIKGTERELNKIKLETNGPQSLTWLNDQSRESDATQWLLWVDDQYRIIKMTVSGSNIEVVRD
ncbi:MAG TPA: hypothetical protein VE133_00145 [Candidatus Sulfotelmatobacter sp.]|nr:hypothetical protein [Candidatus Sulfotelmatobacter sp.]